jgi:hypothetical protein
MHISGKFQGKNAKTYNRQDSQMVAHSSTNRQAQCLCMAERTECLHLTLRPTGERGPLPRST